VISGVRGVRGVGLLEQLEVVVLETDRSRDGVAFGEPIAEVHVTATLRAEREGLGATFELAAAAGALDGVDHGSEPCQKKRSDDQSDFDEELELEDDLLEPLSDFDEELDPESELDFDEESELELELAFEAASLSAFASFWYESLR